MASDKPDELGDDELTDNHAAPADMPLISAAGGDASTGVTPHPTLSTLGVAQTIGPFKLLERIGAGAFGEVFAAEQREPVRRTVALKIAKFGLHTKDARARFEVERQALALMEHPNIAKVFDAGATPDGRPYFALELIKGEPVTKYCDRVRMPIRERIELLITICRAVHHAHQKGVIHRDLKPSNVLVTVVDGKAAPKVIDFGIAKAVGQKLTDLTLHTQAGQFVGTPAYMSPEQAGKSQLDIDTRADVYSLGVMLFELLTGALPFECHGTGASDLIDFQARLQNDDPPKPSTKWTSLGERTSEFARQRSVGVSELQRQVKGDLDWIVLKTLEKDRNLRYDSAAALAEDLTRYLNDEPTAAGPPTAWYRTSKFVRRYRGQVATVVVILFAILLGIIGTTVGMLRASAAQQVAVEARVQAEQAADDAQSQRELALIAAANERVQRSHAESANEQLQQSLYLSQVALAQSKATALDVAAARRHLSACEPKRRGWEWHHLSRLTSEARQTLEGDGTSVLAMAVDAAGTTIALSKSGRTVELRPRDLRAIEKPTTIHLADSSHALAFSPGGEHLAAGQENGELIVIAVKEAKPLQSMSGHSAPITAVLWDSEDNGRVLTAGLDGIVLIRLAETGEVIQRIEAHESGVSAMALSPDGSLLVTGAGTNEGYNRSGLYEIAVWDMKTGNLLRRAPAHTFSVSAIAFSASGDSFVTGSGDLRSWYAKSIYDMKLWDTQTLESRTVGQHTDSIRWVGFEPDGLHLLSASHDGSIRFWSSNSGREMRRYMGHRGPIYAAAFDLQGVLPSLLSVGEDGAVREWNPYLPSFIHPNGGIEETAIAPSGRRIAAIAVREFAIWDLDTAMLLHSAICGGGQAMAYSPDGRWLAMPADPHSIDLLDVRNEWQSAHRFAAERRPIDLSFSHDSQLMAVARLDSNECIVWDLTTYQEHRRIRAENPITQIAFSPHDRSLAVGDDAGGVSIWRDGAEQPIPMGRHLGSITALAWSPTGDVLASGSNDATIHTWRVATGEQLGDYSGHRQSIATLEFSRDGTRLLSAADESTVRLWDVKMQMEAIALTAKWNVGAARFVRDGWGIVAFVWGQNALTLYNADSLNAERTEEQWMRDSRVRVALPPWPGAGRRSSALVEFMPPPIAATATVEWNVQGTDWQVDSATQRIVLQPGESRKIVQSFVAGNDPLPSPGVRIRYWIDDGRFVDAPIERSEPIVLPNRCATLKPMAASPQIDGNLTPEELAGLESRSNFIGDDGKTVAADSTTRFYVGAVSDDKLYVAVRCEAPKGAAAFAVPRPDDADVWRDDCVEIFIQQSGDEPYYQFILSAAGSRLDAANGMDARAVAWNGDWQSAVIQRDGHCDYEVLVDLKKLGLTLADAQMIRFNVIRHFGAEDRYAQWSYTNGRGNHAPEFFGYLQVNRD